MPFVRTLLAAVLAVVLACAPAAATVNSSTSKTIVLGNGSQTVFTFNFIGVASAYISVVYTDAAGNETVLTQGSGATQYQIALNAPVQGAIWGIGGSVTYNPSGTPIASGTTLTIYRTLPLTQAITLQNQLSVQTLGKGAETGLDTGVMQLQQVSENIARAIVVPVSDPTPPQPLPSIAQRANQGAAFDGDGNLVAGAMPASGVISSAMQPVVNAATLALGRAAFGLGTAATYNVGCGLQDDGAGALRVNNEAITSVSTNQSVDATFCNRFFVATGPVSFNLARANTLWNGFRFKMLVLTGAVTLIPNASDSIQGQSSGTNVAIPANSVVTVTGDAAASGNWRLDWSPFNVDGATKSMIGPTGFGAVRALVVTNNAGTPNTKIDITAADVVMINSSSYGVQAFNVAVTIDLTTGTATPAANGLDGHAIPANGDLFIWAISNGATTAGLASTSVTPSLPTGYTFKKYLGAMKTASSILLRTRQSGRDTQYVVTTGSNTTVPPQMATGGAIAAWTAIAVSSYVPSTATRISSIVRSNMATNQTIALAPNNNYATASGGTTVAPCAYVNSSAGPITISTICDLLLEGPNIYWANAGTSVISVLGWSDSNI